MAGDTGAPRPTLVNSAAGVCPPEQDVAIATLTVMNTRRAAVETLVWNMVADHSSVE
jgi:hypothetical protein